MHGGGRGVDAWMGGRRRLGQAADQMRARIAGEDYPWVPRDEVREGSEGGGWAVLKSDAVGGRVWC